MSRPVALSVNGRSGAEATDERQAEKNRELIRRAAASINGANGAAAAPARRGEPAGALYVELIESPTHTEGFVVRTQMQVPENRNPTVTEILPQKDVIFEAIGGDGETGRRGSDGQSGLDGIPGEDATKVQDATAGTPGGNGGNAGAGSNGGDAGHGGQVRIYVDEDKTHLLLATSWEVRGGKGGLPGEHGTPGQGGKGGTGGRSYKWEEQSGYQYKCTPNCAGRTTAPASDLQSLSRRDPRMLMMQGIGDQVSAGSNMQTAVARLANYRANSVRDTAGLCACSGGNGHCTGCDTLPIYQKRKRVKGDNGMDGRNGEKPIDQLFCGRDGRPGEGLIIVKPRTAGGLERQYRSRYRLELIDFDLEDENADGIFEPGEHLFIRRISVKNSGGMPSPTRETQIEVDASDFLQLLPGSDGVTYIPPIPAGHTVTLPGSIKVLIREPNIFVHSGQPYKMTVAVGLKAIIPGLNRRLDFFDMRKSVEIRFPLELHEIDYLQSVAQGSENKISMQIHNQSNKTFGTEQISPRRAQVKISIASDAGSLRLASGVWSPEAFQETKTLPAGSTVDMHQEYKISHGAKDHAYTKIQVQFFIPSPGPIPASGGPLGYLGIPMRLTQSFDLKIQISAAHIYDEDAGILVVTNVKTPPDRFEAIGDFIRRDLHLKMDVWNVSQYGGLVRQDQNEEDDDEAKNVLEEYRGRTIIFLGNEFEHFGLREQTMINLCESDVIGNECFAGTSCLLLGSRCEKRKKETWLKHSVFPVAHKISTTSQVADSATFKNKGDFCQSISEQRISGMTGAQAYKIETEPKWYYGPKRSVKHLAKEAQSYMKGALPQERFWVCPVYPKNDGGSCYVAVWHGLPSTRKIFATESRGLIEERGKPTKLAPFDSFNIICSLPFLLRFNLLNSNERESTTDTEEKEYEHVSVTPQDSATYSNEVLNAVQYSLEEDLHHEIQNYLVPSPVFNTISLRKSQDSDDQFKLHFPCLSSLLNNFEASDQISARSLEVVQMAIAATNPQTIGQVARSLIIPISQRRAQLKSYLTHRVESILVDKGYTPFSLKQFRITTQAKHSRFNSNKRDTGKVIEQRNREFLKVSTNKYRKGRLTTEDLVKGTELCTQQEWDARYDELKKTKVAVKRSITRAMTKKGKMSKLTVGEASQESG